MQKKMTKRPIALAIATMQTESANHPSYTRRSSLASAFILVAAIAQPALAQESEPKEQTLPTVQVRATKETENKESVRTTATNIGKGTQNIRDIPQSITVMTERLIDDAHLPTLREALHYTAGITFAATENGTDQDIRMRGFPVATTGDLLIDGMRDPSQYDRDTFNLDRVEVMRGAASMLFGRGSTGGVINQVSKKPFLADQHEVATTIGTNKNLRVTGDFNFVTGDDSAARINVMRQSADNKGAEIDKYGIAPSFSWGIGTANEFNVGLFHLNVDNVPMAGLRYVNGTIPEGIDAGKFFGAKSDYLTGQASYVHGSHVHRFTDGAEIRTQLRSGVFDRSQWGSTANFPVGTTFNSVNDSTVLTLVGLAPRKDQFKGTFLQSDYSDTFNWLGFEHKIIAGTDLAYESADRYTALGAPGTNFAKGTTTVGAGGAPALNVAPNYRLSERYAARALGLYVQDVMQVAPSWKVVGGLRFDHFNGEFEGSTRTKMSDNPISYRAGVLFQPTDYQSYHLSYSTSFNTAADTYRFTTQQNANTPPEKSRNIEIGAKLDWLDGKLSTRGAIFRTEKYNERTTDSDFANNAYLLSGRRHSQGLEFDVVGSITPKWEIYTSYSYIHEAKIDKAGSAATININGTPVNVTGMSVGLTPKHTGAVWTSYQWTPKLRVAGGLTGRSVNRPSSGATNAASVTARAPGFVVADLMAEYVLDDTWTAQVNINNVADRNYGDQLYPGFWISGPGRQALLTLTARF